MMAMMSCRGEGWLVIGFKVWILLNWVRFCCVVTIVRLLFKYFSRFLIYLRGYCIFVCAIVEDVVESYTMSILSCVILLLSPPHPHLHPLIVCMHY